MNEIQSRYVEEHRRHNIRIFHQSSKLQNQRLNYVSLYPRSLLRSFSIMAPICVKPVLRSRFGEIPYPIPGKIGSREHALQREKRDYICGIHLVGGERSCSGRLEEVCSGMTLAYFHLDESDIHSETWSQIVGESRIAASSGHLQDTKCVCRVEK